MLACLNVIAIGHWYKIDHRHPFRVEGIVDRYQSLTHSLTYTHTPQEDKDEFLEVVSIASNLLAILTD